jgi:HK97 family phage portal protein
MAGLAPLAPSRWRLALRQIATNVLHATDGRDVLLNSPGGWEVEQPWLWWTGNTNGANTIGNPIPGAYGPGFAGIPGVDRCTRLVGETITSLPWHVMRDETERLPTPAWIADPQALRLDGRVIDSSDASDGRLSRSDFWFEWIASSMWWGDGLAYAPTRDTSGAPKPPLWLLNPHDVELREGRWRVSDIELAPGSVIALRRGPIVNGRGTGIFAQFAADLGMSESLREYTAGAFTAGVPAGYLKTSTPNISQEQADSLKARWLSQHGGLRRSIAVLNATTEFHPLTWSPVDLAAVDFSRISLQQIALMFGVPAYLLGVPADSSTYANVESRMTEFYQLTLLAWIKNIEAVLGSQFPLGTELHVVVEGLLRADIKSRTESYKTAVETGWLTVDEVRELEGRPPLTAEPEPVPEPSEVL